MELVFSLGRLSLRYYGPVVWENMLPESFKAITGLGINKWVPITVYVLNELIDVSDLK